MSPTTPHARAQSRLDQLYGRSAPESPMQSFEAISRQTRVPVNVLLAMDDGRADLQAAQSNAQRIATAVEGGKSVESAIAEMAGDEGRAASILNMAYDIADELEPPAPAASDRGSDGRVSFGEAAGGLARDAATGALRGTGGAIGALGVAVDEALRYGADPAQDGPTLARDIGRFAGDAVRGMGDSVAEVRSEDYQVKRAGTQPGGNLMQPSTWTLGDDPSLLGLMGIAAEGLGSMAPIVAAPNVRVAAALGGLMGAGEGVEAGRAFVQDAAKTLGENGRPEIEKLPEYRALTESGMDHGRAVEELARRAENSAGFRQGIVASLGGAATNRIVRGAEGWLGSGGRLARAAKKGGAGALEEGAQEAAEGVASGLGIEAATGADVDVLADSFGNFVGGALAGGSMGAGAGALGRGGAPRETQADAAPVSPEILALPAPSDQGDDGRGGSLVSAPRLIEHDPGVQNPNFAFPSLPAPDAPAPPAADRPQNAIIPAPRLLEHDPNIQNPNWSFPTGSPATPSAGMPLGLPAPTTPADGSGPGQAAAPAFPSLGAGAAVPELGIAPPAAPAGPVEAIAQRLAAAAPAPTPEPLVRFPDQKPGASMVLGRDDGATEKAVFIRETPGGAVVRVSGREVELSPEEFDQARDLAEVTSKREVKADVEPRRTVEAGQPDTPAAPIRLDDGQQGGGDTVAPRRALEPEGREVLQSMDPQRDAGAGEQRPSGLGDLGDVALGDAPGGNDGTLTPAPEGSVAAAAIEAAPEPTEAQKGAGNYRKGHARWNGLDLSIENARGSERSGKGPDGAEWSVTMPADYGYFRRTEGADGDHVDFYMGPNEASETAFIIDQVDAETGVYDEAKVMLGYDSPADARAAHEAAFSDGKGAARLGGITMMGVPELKEWLASDRTKKPASFRMRTSAKATPAPQRRPFITYVGRGFGGIDPDGKAAEELRHRGITSRTAPGLFRRGGRKELDNIVADEHPDLAGAIPRADDGTYLAPQSIIDAIADEVAGQPLAFGRHAEDQQVARDVKASRRAAPDDVAAPIEPGGIPEPERDIRDPMERLAEIEVAVDESAHDLGITLTAGERAAIIKIIDRQGGFAPDVIYDFIVKGADNAIREATGDGSAADEVSDIPFGDEGEAGPAESDGGAGGRPSAEGDYPGSVEQGRDRDIRPAPDEGGVGQPGGEPGALRWLREKARHDPAQDEITTVTQEMADEDGVEPGEYRAQSFFFRGEIPSHMKAGLRGLGDDHDFYRTEFIRFGNRRSTQNRVEYTRIERERVAAFELGADGLPQSILPGMEGGEDQRQSSLTARQRGEIEARQRQSKARRLDGNSGDAGPLFNDQGGLYQEGAPTPIDEQPPRAKASAEKIEDLGEKVGGARKDTAERGFTRGAKAVNKDERPAWMRRYEVNEIVSSTRPEQRGKFTVRDTRTDRPASRELFDTREAAEAAIPLMEVSRNHRVQASEDGAYAINRIVSDKKRAVVKGGFADRDAAMRYMAENPAEIIETQTRVDDRIHPALDEAIREGEARRDEGADVSGQDFMDVFGFRGVEFGNWNNGAERQHLLNQAYDAFIDLAEIMAVPPRALSLNGELALAFGARGHGLSGARAHYERDRGVINLTKIQGAGALAHEWMHAFDHYLARQDGKAKAGLEVQGDGTRKFVASDREGDFVSHGFPYRRVAGGGTGTRPEVRDAFKAVMEAIQYRAAEFTEDVSSRERYAERAQERVTAAISGIRENLTAEQRWGKKTAPATAEKLAEFDAAAARIIDREPGDQEAKNGYMFHAEVWKISDIIKSVRGRQGFSRGQGRLAGPIVDLDMSVRDRGKQDQFLKDAIEQRVKQRKVLTEFASEAWKMDRGAARDYWSTPHEMIARAFESFVYDRLKDVDARNDFLAYEKHNDLPGYRLFHAKPFPEGTERESINDALQSLFDTLGTRETVDGNVELFQRDMDGIPDPEMTPPLASSINAAARTELAKVGISARVRAEAGGTGSAAGTYRRGVIRIIRARPGQWRHTLDHEILHALRDPEMWDGEAGLFTKDEWRALARAARADRAIKARVEEAYPDLTEAGRTEEMVAELYADWAQGRRVAADGPMRAALDRIRSFFRAVAAALRGEGFRGAAQIMERIAAGEIGARGADDVATGTETVHEQRDMDRISAQITQVLAGAKLTAPIALTKSPPVLRRLWGKDVPVVIAPDVIWKASDKHGLTGETIIKAVNGLADPVMVLDSATSADSLVALVDAVSKDGRPVVVALHANQKVGRIEVSRVASIHAKDNDSAIARWMDQGLLRYINGSKAGDWSRSRGLRLPKDGTANRRGKKILRHRDVFKADDRKEQRDMDAPTFAERFNLTDGLMRARGMIGNMHWRDTPKLFSDMLTDAMGKSDKLNSLALVPGRALFSELGKGLRSAQSYLHEKETMDAERNDWHGRGDKLAKRWWALRTKDSTSNQALMDLMHRTTLSGIDPSKADEWEHPSKARAEKLAKTGDPASRAWAEDVFAEIEARGKAHAKLKAEFDALPEAFQNLYRDARDEYAALADAMDGALVENIKVASEISLRRAERAHRKEMERIKDEGLFGPERDQALTEADARLDAAERRARAGAGARMAAMRKRFESNRLSGPYFPLARFGKYFVTIRDAEGKVVSFSRFEKKSQQDAFVKDAKEQGLGRIDHGVLADGSLHQIAQADPRFVAEIENLLADAGADHEIMDAVWQHWLETLPDQSVRTSQIHRKGRAGYSPDAFRAFGKQMFHGAHQLARLKHGLKMEEMLNVAAEEAAAGEAPERMGFVVQEMRRRHDFTMNPTGNPITSSLTSIGFVWYLGMSPAAALVNVSQTTLIGTPIMATRFKDAGVGGSVAAVTRAMRDFADGRGWSEKSSRLTDDEKRAMQEAYRLGTIDKTQAHDLASVADSGVEYSPARQAVMEKIGWMFHHTERLNREVTFLANYRLARAEGMDSDAAIREASDLTWKIHFDYQNSSRPRFMQGDVAKVILLFRSYTVNTLWRLFRDSHQTFHGKSREERAEARSQLIGITLSMMAHAGIRGAWGYGLLMTLLGLFFPGGDDDAEKWLENALLMEGDDTGTAAWNWIMGMALNGAPGHVTGLDLTSRIGMPNLWFRDSGRDMEGTDAWNQLVNDMLGPVIGIGAGVARGMGMMSRDSWRGIESGMPKFIRDGMQAYRFATYGAVTLNGDPLIENVNPYEVLAKVSGFTPARLSERYRINNRLKNEEKRIMDERKGIHRDVARSVRGGSPVTDDLRQRIGDFNRRYPEYPITADTIRQSVRGQIRASDRNESGISLNPKLDGRIRSSQPPALYNH